MVDAYMETSMHIEDMAYSCFELSRHLRHMLWARHSPEMQKNLQAIFLESHCPSTSSRATSLGGSGAVADVPTDHPSCSKQHAILQYRQVCHMLQLGFAKHAEEKCPRG